MSHENLFISIAGLISAGKSTLTQALSDELKLTPYYEPVTDNPYLDKFYKDMSKYAFPMQIWLLNKRYLQHQQISWLCSKKGAVQDRSLFEDRIFAKILMDMGCMEKQDFDTYLELFDNMKNNIRLPNFIIYLHVTPEVSMERIRMRSRECEKDISFDYIQRLYNEYEQFINDISKVIPVFHIEYSEFKSGKEMADEVLKKWDQLTRIV